MFNVILVVIMVSNGRFYDETPQFVVEYPTQEACMAAAAKYPIKGISFQRAICVPKLQSK